MSQEFESRRQRRIAEAQAQAQVPAQAQAEPLIKSAPNLSRRELRQKMATELVTPAPFQSQPNADYLRFVNDAVVTAASFDAPSVNTPVPSAPIVPTPSVSRRDLRVQLRQPDEYAVLDAPTPAVEFGDVPGAQMFQTSSGFSLDTTTNSIVLPVAPDALSGPVLIETGVTLRTGSIPLPNLNTATGSIPLPQAAQIADEAQRLDSSSSFVSSISPVAAQNLIRQNPKLGFAPIKSTGSHGQLFYGLTTSILMLTVGGLLVVAWMYGFIK